jgi:isocitrate lyase
LAPIVADGEAGYGGILNAYELMKAMIEAGAAAVHFEDQLSSAKKCGHLGGKVVVPICEFVQKLVAARLAADVMSVPMILIARTDADAARLLVSDVDGRDERFLTGGQRPHDRLLDSALVVEESLFRADQARRLRMRCTRDIPASCWRTTARRGSTGTSCSARSRLRDFKANWCNSVIDTSS